MSNAAIDWAKRLPIPACAKSVLICLGDHASQLTGLSWPGVAVIVRETSRSPRSVRRAITWLIGEALIESANRAGGRGIKTTFRLNLHAVQAVRAVRAVQAVRAVHAVRVDLGDRVVRPAETRTNPAKVETWPIAKTWPQCRETRPDCQINMANVATAYIDEPKELTQREPKESAHKQKQPTPSIAEERPPPVLTLTGETEPKRKRRGVESPIDPLWQPDATDAAAARDLGVVDIPGEGRRFVNYHLARDTRFVNWRAAWRTWCDNCHRYSRQRGPTVVPLRRPYGLLDAAIMVSEEEIGPVVDGELAYGA